MKTIKKFWFDNGMVITCVGVVLFVSLGLTLAITFRQKPLNLNNGFVEIVDKSHKPESSYTIYQKVGSVTVPTRHKNSESWSLTVQQLDSKTNKYNKETIKVTRYLYEDVSIGDKLIYENGELLPINSK